MLKIEYLKGAMITKPNDGYEPMCSGRARSTNSFNSLIHLTIIEMKLLTYNLDEK